MYRTPLSIISNNTLPSSSWHVCGPISRLFPCIQLSPSLSSSPPSGVVCCHAYPYLPCLVHEESPILPFPSGFPHVPHSILRYRSGAWMEDRHGPILLVGLVSCFGSLYIEEYTRNWQLFSISVIITPYIRPHCSRSLR